MQDLSSIIRVAVGSDSVIVVQVYTAPEATEIVESGSNSDTDSCTADSNTGPTVVPASKIIAMPASKLVAVSTSKLVAVSTSVATVSTTVATVSTTIIAIFVSALLGIG